ncbi:helix-turn-helix transcriptional regulator [Aquabacterium sp.]|uniref:helix-turn-helix transcriptional regulator n=1 Tax=Aquabacterium sp. TaxID=1872578 RepID=UPI002C43322B|nr:WYL domain-containing protein [Aquabacterium sp.]HSW05841.1 WYL domain-containing protein [Aquabacterium sp.]
MRASRLLSMLMLLQTRGRLSAPALARALEVSVRTVYRDIDQLSAAGVPVWGEQGRSGGFQLREGWRTQLTGLTVPEARAIFLAGLPGPAAELGLGEAMATAQLKLLAALPADWHADAQQVASRFHLDAIDWFRSAAPPPQLKAVAEAVWLTQRLALRYESWQGVSDRVVEPLGLVLKAGTWYMAAMKTGNKAGNAAGEKTSEARVYRLAAIQALELLPETFQRPANFDLAAWWAQAAQRFEAGVYRDEARLRVTELGLQRLMAFNPRVAEAALNSAEPLDEPGWVAVTVPIESIAHAAREMLRLGAEGQVLAPPALREQLAATARAMASLYGPPAPPAAA